MPEEAESTAGLGPPELVNIEPERSNRSVLFARNLLLLPFRVLWNLLLTVAMVSFAVMWWSLLLGSIVPFLLVLIFAPHLFLLPLFLAAFYLPLWPAE